MTNKLSFLDEELPKSIFLDQEEEEEEEEGGDGGEGGEGGDDGDTGSDEGGDTGSEGDSGSDGGDTGSAGDSGAGDSGSSDTGVIEPEVRGGKVTKKGGDDGDDDDVDPADKARIEKIVAKQLNPMQETIQKQNDELEVNSYIAEHPEASKIKATILTYMSHEAYKNIPVKNIANMLLAPEMMKIGAQKEREAQRKANDTRGGGSQHRKPSGGAVDYSKLNNEEMEKEIAKAKGMN